MNRLLLTAAAVLTMGVSSHAMAASYTLDSFSGANAVGNDIVTLNGAGDSYSTGAVNYTTGDGFAFTRTVDFTQTAGTDAAMLLMTDNFQGTPMGDETGAYVMNSGGTNSTLKLSYDIGALDATVGTGSVRFNINVLNSDAGEGHPSAITAYLDGSATPLDSWSFGYVPQGIVPPAIKAFTVSGSQLTTNSKISFVLSGANGYNTTVAPLSFDVIPFASDVSPVPEAGLLPMFGSGLLVMGFAARRRLRARSR